MTPIAPGHQVYDNDSVANLVNIKFWKKEIEEELFLFTPILKMVDMVTQPKLTHGNEICLTIAARPKLGNTTKLVCGGQYVCRTRLFEQCSVRVNCWRSHSFGVCWQTDVQSMVNQVEHGKKTIKTEMEMDISYDVLCVLFQGISTCTPLPSICDPCPTAGSHFLDPVNGICQEYLDEAIELLQAQGVPLGNDVFALADIKCINKIRRALEGLCTPFCKPGDPDAKNIGRLPLTNANNIMKPQFIYQDIGFYAIDFAGEDPLNKLRDPATGTHYLYIFHKTAIKMLMQSDIKLHGPYRDAKSTDDIYNADALYGIKFYSCSRAVILPIVC